MNVNYFVKCDVCGTVTRVRIQAGWLESHPIRFACPECKILIKGNCELNEGEGTVKPSFDNGSFCNEKSSYFIESSGELVTLKITKDEYKEYPMYSIPPFFNAQMNMEDDIKMFINNINEYLRNIKPNWASNRRILELYNNKQYTYFDKEIEQSLPNKMFPCNNALERLRAANFLIYRNVNIFHDKGFVEFTSKAIGNKFFELDKEELIKFLQFFNDKNDMLSIYQKKIIKTVDELTNVFNYLIPAYGLTFYKEYNIDYSEYGTTTCSFEDIKQFYLDAYETLTEILILPIGLNNILYRGRYEVIDTTILNSSKIKTFKDLVNSSKGQRIKFFNNEEFFAKILNISFNTKLRNAIGHNDYEYDGITQKITYIPDSSKPEKKQSVYLLEFGLECIRLIKGIAIIQEILYRSKMIDCMNQGYKPTVVLNSLNTGKVDKVVKKVKKVGRNEPCPCGSGKKYKKCCGDIK